MSSDAPEPLAPDVATRLVEFARACRAAARAVTMYPPTHPAIQAAVDRIVDAGAQATAPGPLAVTVLPDTLLVDGRALTRPDAAVTELAALLHIHRVGALTVRPGMAPETWHRFVALAAQSPDEVRAAGGLARAWATAGGGPLDIREIDYAEVLRSAGGTDPEATTWAQVIARALDGGPVAGSPARALMQDLAGDPARLGGFLEQLEAQALATGDAAQHRATIMGLLHGLVDDAAAASPDDVEPLLDSLAAAAARLSPELLLALVTGPPAGAGGDDIGPALRARLSADHLATFVAASVVRDRGATSRLAQALHALAPEPETRAAVLSAAEARVADGLPDDDGVDDIWSSAVELLTSYSDRDYVSDAYASELGRARADAIGVEALHEDPPERLAAWLASVDPRALRQLDLRLLLDLLDVETREEAWSYVARLALVRAGELLQAGDMALARRLLDALRQVANDTASPFAAAARAGLAQAAPDSLARPIALLVRRVSDAEMAEVSALCDSIGPALIAPLAETLATETDSRTVRRLRDVLIAFGAGARAYADELRSSPNPSVRRAAIELLRAVGGHDALPDFRSLLDDAEPQVQREALRAIVQLGSDEAYAALEQALVSGAAPTREAIMLALGTLRDERAAPLFVHILRHTDHRGGFEPVYRSAVEALGRFDGAPEIVEALRMVLERGEWWAPGRTARLRLAAARALRAAGGERARRVLEAAADSGPRGARRAARRALAEPAAGRRPS
ncbi:MAG: HEAT repeat domain-containing protein [Vicinamibacterales bacterium]